ncbi:unnamed protein product [Pipistrellus nathusii]|uniref:Mucin-6 n=1 Tax=Pipistrellus nathusii TaxID=59473 RepID=A0ABP0AH28_PIPNA
MLGPRLLLLWCWGALLGAGLDDTSFAHLGPQGLKDSPQPAAGRGWCSTWGSGHFSTFDGHVYDFEGTCNYVFAAICKDASSPTFSVQLRREPGGNISRIIVELGASVVTVQQGAISIKDVGAVSLPYTGNGLQITPFGQSMRLVAKQLELELVVLWGPGAHLTVLVEDKHKGRMCGLCGNFDGEKTNEFLSEDGTHLEPHKYAALQKLDDPNEICVHEAVPGPRVPQAEHARTCAQLLALVAPECDLPKEPFAQSCQADLAACAEPGRQSCACATLSAYSHHCSLAGQPVSRWRRPGLCSLGQCPANQVYQECGEACVKTCSHPQHSCAHSCTFGCFCPEGLVLDDVSKNLTCVPVAQCPCTLSGVAYAPGAVTADACRSCQCTMGRWKCEERPCPQPCALEGGSFVTTFDARPYRFHGTCTYILLQSPQLPDGGTLLAAYDKSGYSHSETSLVTLIYMNSQDKILITQDQVVANEEAKSLPYKMGNITVFRQTSTHLQMATTFGLDLVVQLQPMFQAYITVGPRFRGQTRGLCGNFNGDTTDDFMTSTGIPEGTATLFVDSWRAGNCPAAMQRETDPCSMSQLNKVCAETHCAVLMNKSAIFERCHAVVDPKPFYRRCVYQACNYEETFLHICSALGDYAHTCASKGVLLRGWRSSVDNCTIPCTGNQTYSYDSRACGRTCLSLSDHAAECHPSAVPMEGCNCPEGTYLNHRAECVRKAQCPCLVDNKLILAGQSTVVEGDICYCSNGRLSCPGQQLMLLASCSASKTYQSCSQSSRNKFGAACAPTCQMLATGIPCMPIKCEPGCVCAEGLYENASGQCVPPEECPCEFGGVSYPRGAELNTDCKACICSSGKWTCQQSAHCSSTCTLYGEGHVVTFDGQRFVFEGSCEYILATDGCGTDDSRPTFKILTENVVCGKQGVTCSRAIRMSLGGLSIVLADGNYTVSGTDAQVYFRVKADSLHLIVDVTIGSSYNLTVNWNKHMAVSLKISRASQDPLCGLCGNFNGNMKDDFETRSKYVVSSELEFVNSWKESPLCGDARLPVDPCSLNAFHQAWAERKCSIINSQTFAACHGQVYRQPYYEACVRDTCGCDMSGNCECLCDAVAAYAKACLDKGVCVDWRGPDFCPIYCDFYNSHTRADDGQYQYAQETNCTWHYQPCLCPQQLQSLPYTNMEGCYNCSQDEYFDQDKGTCVQCMLPTTPSPPTTEARPTSATPNVTATPGTTGPLSSAAPSSAQTGTAPTTQPEPTVSSGESPRTTSAITTRATSGPAPTATPGSTATGPTVTRATTQPTTSLLSTATQSTARSTVRTTAAWPMPTTPGLATGSPQAPHSAGTAKTTTSLLSHPSAPALSGTTFPPRTTFPKTTGGGTGSPGPHTATATPNGPHTPLTSHSAPTGSVATTSHITGPPSGTSFRTTTTFPTPSSSNTTQSTQVPSSATSSVTATSHRVVTPTQPHTPFPYISTTRPTGSSPSSTHGPATGTVLSPSTPPWATATRGTTQAPHSDGTAKTTTSLLSHPSTPALAGTTSPPRTSMFPKTTGGGTGSPGPHTDTATPNGPHTPLTSHSAPTGSVATTSHITGPPSGTSFRTTTTFPTPSPSITTQSTQVPSSATSSVTATSHRVVTPTQPHTLPPYISTTMPTGSSPSSTHDPATGTVLSPSTPPWATATRGTTQAPHSAGTAKTTTSLLSHPSAPALSGTTSPPRTSMFPKTTGLGTGSPGPHTDTATPNGPQTPFTTHSAPTGSVATTSHITGPPSGTSFRTSTTFPTPSPSISTQSTQVPSSATSSVTATSHRVVTPTQPHTHPPYISTARPTGSSPSSTHGPATGTVLSPSTPPWATATRGTTQAPHSAGTAKTTTSLLSHPSAPALSGTTSPPRTSMFPKTTGGGTGSPGPHTATATPNGPHTPLTSHSAPTGSVSTTSHITGPPSGTSFRTTTTFPTPSPSNTTQSTQVPSSATSSVTATSHKVVTSTQPHTPFPYISTTRPTGSSPSSTHDPATGTVLSPSTPPWATATRGTTQAPHSAGTAKTTTSLLSHPSAPALSGTTSPPRTSMFPKTTGLGTGSPGPHTDTATTNGPQTPFTSHSAPTGSVATTSHITGPPSGTSFRTTTTFPTPSPSNTTQSTQVPSSATSSVTATSHRVVTPTQPHTHPPYISTARPTGSSPSSTHGPATGTVLSPSTPPWATATRGTTQAPHSAGTAKTTTSLLSHPSAPALSGTTSPPRTSMFPKTTGGGTWSPGTYTATATPNWPHTPFTSHFAPMSSVSTTSQSTSLTTRVPMPSLMSSTLGVTSIRSSPATNLTTKHPGTTGLLTTVFLASSITAHRSSSSPTPWSSTSSLLTSVPGYSKVCRVREQEEEVTYQGCTANVTVTRCEGVCASSARFNAHTKEVNTLCSCCHPLGYYEKQLVLPCPDPGAPGEQLVLTLQVFKHCICGLWRCRDLGPALLARG